MTHRTAEGQRSSAIRKRKAVPDRWRARARGRDAKPSGAAVVSCAVTEGSVPEPCVPNPTELLWFHSGNRSLSLILFPVCSQFTCMARDEEPIRPMTLGSMRRHGVRGLFVTCQHCGHERADNMDDWPDEATVPSFGPSHALSPLRQAWRDGCAQLDRTADRLRGGSRR